MQDSVPPQPQYDTRPGRWIAEEPWPSPRIETQRLHLNWGVLSPEADEIGEASFSSPQTLGVRAGEWCGFGADGERPAISVRTTADRWSSTPRRSKCRWCYSARRC